MRVCACACMCVCVCTTAVLRFGWTVPNHHRKSLYHLFTPHVWSKMDTGWWFFHRGQKTLSTRGRIQRHRYLHLFPVSQLGNGWSSVTDSCVPFKSTCWNLVPQNGGISHQGICWWLVWRTESSQRRLMSFKEVPRSCLGGISQLEGGSWEKGLSLRHSTLTRHYVTGGLILHLWAHRIVKNKFMVLIRSPDYGVAV